MNKDLERFVETDLRKGIQKRHGFCIKFTSPSMDGLPDRVILLPWRKFYLVETKRQQGKLSLLQKTVHALFAKIGFPVETIYTKTELLAFFERIDEE